MNDTADAWRQFGTGPLSRAAALIYRLLVAELLLLLSIMPGLVPLVLLDRNPSNLPLVAVCALPLGPGISAALYCLHRHRADLTELNPAADFWRGYRLNVLLVLRIWAPLLGWLTIIAVNLVHLDSASVPAWWAPLLVAVAALACLWGTGALVIASLFAFRARDVARLAAYFLARTPGVTVGTTCLLVVAFGVTVLQSEAVLALLGSVLALMLLRTSQPMIRQVDKEFTA